jgi:rfaE bifunctional protein kinase chain/domain/rfaE bifunctional protein nucleotidyltransferase chain/domain
MINDNGTSSRIIDLDQLPEVLDRVKADGKKVVHCHGVFDLLHIGHIRHFGEARKMGDVLVVTLTPDHYVNKGPHRPAFNESLRAEAIAALDCVDYVAVNKWPTAVETIKLVMPDVYVKGSDYKDYADDDTGKIVDEEASVKSVGGEIAFTDDITFSSTSLINRHLPAHDSETSEYLALLTKKYSVDAILDYLRNAWSLKTLVIGETIIDEYQYCDMIGKSTKEPILAVRYQSTETFIGGIVAAVNHVANFSENVGLLSFLGDQNTKEDIVRASVNKNVEQMYIQKSNSPTIVKRRFVEGYLLQKLFEVYEINDDELDEAQNKQFCAWLEEVVPQYDVVIILDYGHGLMTKEAINLVCQKAKFLAVNTQSNAGNRGFNTISRYPRADYVCLANHEIALEERNRHGDLREMITNVSRKLDCERVVVTRGKDGNLCYSRKEGFVTAPALANEVVDRMGAGDSVISVTSLCAAQGAPMEIIGFIGNVVGAEAVATMAHRSSIEKVSLIRHIESLLK